MKLAITVEIDVDIVAWSDEYGIRGPEIKPDVQNYILDLVQQSHAGSYGLIRTAVTTKCVEKR